MAREQNWKMTAVVGGTVMLLALAISFSPLVTALNKRVTLPIDFYVRTLLGRNPEVSPMLKIYAFDDLTLQHLDRPELSLKEWGGLLAGIAEAKPRAIYIDKLFGTPEVDGRADFVRLMDQVKAPVVAGGFLQRGLVRKSGQVDFDTRSEYSWSSHPALKELNPNLPRTEANLYGPHIAIQGVFSKIGHLAYAGDGRVPPWIEAQEDKVVPHLTLASADDSAEAASNALSNIVSALDRAGYLTVNLVPPVAFSTSRFSLKSALERVASGDSFESVIRPGQSILILPGAYTGSSDWVETPIGYLPGGYVVASMLNSMLTGQWLVSPDRDWLWSLGAVTLAAVLPWGVSPAAWLAVAAALGVGITLLGLMLFVFGSIVVAWPLVLGAYAITSVSLFVAHRQYRERRLRDEQVHRAAMNAAAAVVHDAFFHGQQPMGRLVGFSATHEAADSLGGDWYGIYEFPEPEFVFLFIGDVTGHGISSALMVSAVAGAVSATLKKLVESGLAVEDCLREMVGTVNGVVYEAGFSVDKGMTMAFLGLDLKKMKAHLINCAHLPVYIKHKDQISVVAVGGDVMGMAPTLNIKPVNWDLELGDLIVVVTDGMFDNRGPAGQRFKSTELRKLLQSPHMTPAALGEKLNSTLKSRWQGVPLIDDRIESRENVTEK